MKRILLLVLTWCCTSAFDVVKLKLCASDEFPLTGAYECVKESPQPVTEVFMICKDETSTNWFTLKDQLCNATSDLNKCLKPKIKKLLKNKKIRVEIGKMKKCLDNLL